MHKQRVFEIDGEAFDLELISAMYYKLIPRTYTKNLGFLKGRETTTTTTKEFHMVLGKDNYIFDTEEVYSKVKDAWIGYRNKL